MGMLMRRHRIKVRNRMTGHIGNTPIVDGEGVTEDPSVAEAAKALEGVTVTEVTEDGDGEKLTPKKALQAQLEALGLPTDGKVDELKARLAEAEKFTEPVTEGEPTEGDSTTEDTDNEDDDESTDADGSTDGEEG